MGRENVRTSAVSAKKRTGKTIVTFSIPTSVQRIGKLHQRKMPELEVGKDLELREKEVKPEVEIEGGKNPKKVVGSNSLHINPEIGLRG